MNDLVVSVVCILLALSLVMGGGALKYFLWYLRTIQITAHLPMFSVPVPANVAEFFKLMIPVLTFDVLDPEWTTLLVFNFDFDWHEKNVNDQIIS